MTEAKSTLDKVMAVLGMQAPVAVAEPAVEPAVELAEGDPIVPEEEVPAVEEVKEEETKMSVEDMISALDAKVSAIADAVAKLVAAEVEDEAPLAPLAPVEEAAPIPTAMNKLSAQPKFNGAPVETPKNSDAVKLKVDGTMSTVLSRLYGN
jgi:hypothetical protein